MARPLARSDGRPLEMPGGTGCPGRGRHWFSARSRVAGGTGLRLPFCARGCGAPNPRPLSDDEWAEYEGLMRVLGRAPLTRDEYIHALAAVTR